MLMGETRPRNSFIHQDSIASRQGKNLASMNVNSRIKLCMMKKGTHTKNTKRVKRHTNVTV